MSGTVNIKLRALQLSDKELVLKWENDKAMWVYSGAIEDYTEAEIETFVSNPQNLMLHQQERFIITLNNDSVIGCVDLFEYSKTEQCASVGILIDSIHQNKGYALIALNKIARIAKEKYNIKHLKATILEDNIASIKTFKKAGYFLDKEKKEKYNYEFKAYNLLTFDKKI